MRPYTPRQLFEVLQPLFPVNRYWIAFSGGLDSMVLLHSMASLRADLPGVALQAVHIDHGLHPESPDWSCWCVAQAEAVAVPCEVVAVEVAREKGASLEAQARDARYAAFATHVKPGDCLLTAHHADDQAETLLLQLLRGAGVHGLAAMPFTAPFAGGVLARPLLDFTRAQLAGYAVDHGLQWLDDPANENTGFDRNYLRHNVMPVLRDRWPAVAATVGRSAGHCANAARLLDEVAARDMLHVADENGALCIDRLRDLPGERQCHLLRHWLRTLQLPVPRQTRTEQIIIQMLGADVDRYPLVAWPGAEVRRYRDRLYAMPPLTPHDARRQLRWDIVVPLELPWLAQRVVAVADVGNGLSVRLCEAAPVTIRFRQGGEMCRPSGSRHHKALKKLFQEYGLPAWERDRVPLIYLDEQLAAVGGYWICEPFQAAPDEPAVRPEVQNIHLRNSGRSGTFLSRSV